MNYRHSYHAGNFADAFKHVILLALMLALQKKDKPLCYLDSHAGRELYDLQGMEAQKTAEYKTGIEPLFKHKEALDLPPVVKRYLELVQTLHYPQYYPGSTGLMREMLRENDRMIALEYHPEEAAVLKKAYRHDKKISVHEQDGYLGLKAFLPPKERRGLIFIDPSYEKKEEWLKIIENLSMALKRFSQGVYVIWYPLKDNRASTQFLQDLKSLNTPVLAAELSIYPQDSTVSLFGSGMAILNPPWQFEEELNQIVPWLWKNLSINQQGSYSIFCFD